MQRLAKKLLIIGWDAADWNLINPLLDTGLLPTLAGVVERGCIGNLASLRPSLSPMLWTSIATGKLADKHGISGFVEPLEDMTGVRLVGSNSRNCKAFWNICAESNLKTHAIAWYASHPAEKISGVCVSDQFLAAPPTAAEWVNPPSLAAELGTLRVSPAEIGAGDLLPLIPKLGEIDLANDPRPGRLAHALAACASTHAIATHVLSNQEWDVAAIYYDALDRIGHEFMPFHPPRLRSIEAREFELYQHVVAGMYRFFDMMLDTLLQIAGSGTTVMIVSDHGFHSGHLRPAHSSAAAATAALWHRHYGVFALAGPGIRADERVYGATLLDVAPTILALLGLPIGRDMAGRALVETFVNPPKLEFVPTWETSPRQTQQSAPSDPAASAAAVKQLVELGYLAPESQAGAEMAQLAVRESRFNLAITHLQVGQTQQAINLLVPLTTKHPQDLRFAAALASAYAASKQFRDAHAMLKPMIDAGVINTDIDLIFGSSLQNLGETEAAISYLARARQTAPDDPAVHRAAGEAYLLGQRLADAEQAFRRALELDPDSEQSHFGLGRAMLQVGNSESAAEHALRAVGLVHAFPQAHYLLGMALWMLNDQERAILAMQTAIAIQPNFAEAHQKLAEWLLNRGDVAASMQHQKMAQGR